MVKESKTQKALRLFCDGKYKEAFSIFKHFKLQFSKEEKRSIEIAAESLAGKESFYSALGIDTKAVIQNAISIINAKYC